MMMIYNPTLQAVFNVEKFNCVNRHDHERKAWFNTWWKVHHGRKIFLFWRTLYSIRHVRKQRFLS